MRSPDFTYKLDNDQFDQALSVLKKEHNNKISLGQKWMAVFNFFLFGYIYLFVIMIALSYMPFISETTIFVFLVALSAWVLVLIILFFINIPLFKMLRRRAKVIRKLGITDDFLKGKRKISKKETFLNYGRNGTYILGVLVMLFSIFKGIEYFSSIDADELKVGIFANVLSLAFVVFISFSLAMNYLMRKYKTRLELVNKLQTEIESYKKTANTDESETVEIPLQQYDELAQLERQQISFDRMDSALQSFKTDDLLGYSTKKSKKASLTFNKLKASNKLLVSNFINELAMDPEIEGSITDNETNLTNVKIPGTELHLYYKIDRVKMNINILSISE